MKKFNINHEIYIQITNDGWKYLMITVGKDYIDHCIKPHRYIIDGYAWYKLQAHVVFSLLPIGVSAFKLKYLTNILIDDDSLIDFKG